MRCSTADTHHKLLDSAVSSARFLTVGLFDCDIAYRRSLAVLCMLYEIRGNPVHPLNGAIPLPYVPVRVRRGALAKPSTAPGLGVCEWSPEGLYDKSVSLIPNTDEILKLVKKKMN